MSAPRILVVHRESTFSTQLAVRKSPMIELALAGDPLVDIFLEAHRNHASAMERISAELEMRGLEATFRHNIDDIDPNTFELVITVGGDGTVLHASHAIGSGVPVLAVNSAPSTSVGYLTCADAGQFGQTLDGVLSGRLRPILLSRMTVEVNDVVVARRALNDVLFSHDCPASTTRYVLSLAGTSELQLSSGVWVATAAGSTAAIHASGGKLMPPRSRRLQFAVRESYPHGGVGVHRTPPRLVQGFVEPGQTLEIRSMIRAAKLWVDGPHVMFPVEFGDTLSFCLSDEPLRLFGFPREGK